MKIEKILKELQKYKQSTKLTDPKFETKVSSRRSGKTVSCILHCLEYNKVMVVPKEVLADRLRNEYPTLRVINIHQATVNQHYDRDKTELIVDEALQCLNMLLFYPVGGYTLDQTVIVTKENNGKINQHS